MGTATMTLEETGAYVRLLAYQWDTESVPGDDMPAMGRLLGVSTAKARALWQKIGGKFQKSDHGWRNNRLESEREKQQERRRKLAENGKLGGAIAQANARANAQAPDKQLVSLPSPSPFSVPDPVPVPRVPTQAPGALAGSLPRDHMHHAWCGPQYRLCVTHKQMADLEKRWGGDGSRQAVEAFLNALEAGLGANEGVGGPVWLLQHFDAYMTEKGRLRPAPTAAELKAAAKRNDFEEAKRKLAAKYGEAV